MSYLALGMALAACGAGTTTGAGPTVPARTSPAASPSANPTATASATGTPAPSQSSTPATAPTPTPTPGPTPPTGGSSPFSIYLGDIYQGAVLIYSSNANGATSPSAVIAGSNTGFTDSTGSSPIYGIAVDESGTVYVLTQTMDSAQTAPISESILVFPTGTTGNVAPARTIALPNSIDAESLAYAASQLYVSDDAGAGAIDVYAASANGPAAAARIFTSSSAFTDPPLKVSVDASGVTFVATYDETGTPANEANQGVYAFPNGANGSVAATSLTGTNTGFGSGVLDAAIVDSSDRIDAVLEDQTNDEVADIDEFAPGATGNATPATAFQDSTSQGPIDAAVDGAARLYVSEIANSQSYAQVNVFAPGATSPQQTLLAYEGALPFIAIGPYVAVQPSSEIPLIAHPLTTASTKLRRLLATRKGRRGRRAR